MKVEAGSFKVLSVETRIKIIEMLKAGSLPVFLSVNPKIRWV